MNEDELRALVRETVRRHLGRPEAASARLAIPAARLHASHVLLSVHPGEALDDGLCLIEPTVRCNHCGYCQSYGH